MSSSPATAHMRSMIVIPSVLPIVHGFQALLPGDRRVLTPEDRAKLPKGTITIDADDAVFVLPKCVWTLSTLMSAFSPTKFEPGI